MVASVRLLKEEEAVEPAELVEEPSSPGEALAPRTPVDRAQLLTVLEGLSNILAARLILCVALLGAIALGMIGAFKGTLPALTSAGLFDVCVLVPLVYLALKKG